MNHFVQYTSATAPEGSRPMLRQVRKAMGFVPNLYATFAESPAVLQGVLALEASLDKGALTRIQRELVKIAVSTENACSYCVAVHSTLAEMRGARAEIVAAVRSGGPVPDPMVDALVTFTRAVVRHKGFVIHQGISAFLAAGFTKAQVMEVAGHIGLMTFHDHVHAMSQAPLDDPFRPQQWELEVA